MTDTTTTTRPRPGAEHRGKGSWTRERLADLLIKCQDAPGDWHFFSAHNTLASARSRLYNIGGIEKFEGLPLLWQALPTDEGYGVIKVRHDPAADPGRWREVVRLRRAGKPLPGRDPARGRRTAELGRGSGRRTAELGPVGGPSAEELGGLAASIAERLSILLSAELGARVHEAAAEGLEMARAARMLDDEAVIAQLDERMIAAPGSIPIGTLGLVDGRDLPVQLLVSGDGTPKWFAIRGTGDAEHLSPRPRWIPSEASFLRRLRVAVWGSGPEAREVAAPGGEGDPSF